MQQEEWSRAYRTPNRRLPTDSAPGQGWRVSPCNGSPTHHTQRTRMPRRGLAGRPRCGAVGCPQRTHRPERGLSSNARVRGTVAQLTDPAYASSQFYDALLRVSDWQTKPWPKSPREAEPLTHTPSESRTLALSSPNHGAPIILGSRREGEHAWGGHRRSSGPRRHRCAVGMRSPTPIAEMRLHAPRARTRASA